MRHFLLYLSDLELASSGSTVNISSNGQRFAVLVPNLLIKSTIGFCHDCICRTRSASAKHNCKYENLKLLIKTMQHLNSRKKMQNHKNLSKNIKAVL